VNNGVATFYDLNFSKAGSGYTLTAAVPGSMAGVSPPFNVADDLVVTSQPPGTVTAGAAFGLVVSAEDTVGHVDTLFSGSVTVSDVEGYSLGGTLTVKAANGVARFTGLVLQQAGGNAIVATVSGGFPVVYSNHVVVTAQAATHLAIVGPILNDT
jgi:hypothetical protein